jgi:hypothetical protein
MLWLPYVPRFCADVFVPAGLKRMSRVRGLASAAAMGVLLLCGHAATAQSTGARDLITKPINDRQRVVLRGNRYPLARAEFDRGEAPASLPMRRMLLVLKRSDRQEAALKAFLADQQAKGSAQYHRWLKPDEFGKEFGASDSDVEQVTAWLNAHGFQVAGPTKGRTAIEFSGTAGQVKEAFGTAIHRYEVAGEQHWANASEPSIPAALAPAVRGVLTLHNFPRHSNAVIHGQPVKAAQGKASSYFTFAAGQSTFYGLGPNVLRAGADGLRNDL